MTKDAAPTVRASSLSFAGWPVRRKIALALALPLLLAATLGALRVQGDVADATSAGRSAEQVTIIRPAIAYLTASETAMVAAQTEDAAAQGDLTVAIDGIVAAAETLTEARDAASLDELQTAHVNALLDLGQAMRGDQAQNLSPATWIFQVRQLESRVSQLVTSVNAVSSTPQPRLEQISQAMSGRLSLAMQQALVANPELAQSGSQELFAEIGVEALAIDRLAGSLEGAEALTSELRGANARHASQIRDDSATELDGPSAYQPYDEIAETLITGATAALSDAAATARNRALLGAIIMLTALAAAVALALVVGRSLLRAIDKVREGALAVARHRLPDAVARIRAGEEPDPVTPIDVTSNDEIGQVARVVDDLHRQALHLATDEAQLRQTVNAMFVTLSRRSNSLVNQQLAQIERLEHDEEDPKRLESLFRLDHLASRMRRTADSLLILADAPSRDAGSFSLTVGEALQAATSGVQNYKRVEILSYLSTRIGDTAAPDVVHLLTELVDNALTFSPPSEPVRLTATLDGDGVTITVTDSGLGVPEAELDMLNRALAHGAEATPDTARRMGLFVVSRLAERHGVVASLVKNPGGGMTATVLLPPAVLPELSQTATPAPTSPISSKTTFQTSSQRQSSAPAPAPAPAVAPAPAPVPAPVPAVVPVPAHAASPAAAEARSIGSDAQPTKRRRRGWRRAATRAPQSSTSTRQGSGEVAVKPAEQVDAPAAAMAQVVRPDFEPVTSAPASTSSEPAAARPSLDSLLPRREPGAHMPRTGADAFLPTTSGHTGPQFAKHTSFVTPESADGPADDEATSSTADPLANGRVASVVPITAWADRHRAQVEETAEADVVATHPDPLGDPLPAACDAVPLDVELSMDHPPVEPTAEPTAEPPAEPTVEPTAEPTVEVTPDEPAARAGAGLPWELPARIRGAEDEVHQDLSGTTPSHGSASRTNGESSIFKSMRSGWLAGDEGDFRTSEVDRGWEIAESIAEQAPAALGLTPIGLPLRAPGERLIPGSVSPPEPAKTRDPDAIRRRLQAHTAGVSRGRRAAQDSSQHTEAGSP